MLTEAISTEIVAQMVSESTQSATVKFAGSVTTSDFMPAFIPRDQAYFWSIPWQESERRALADLAAGRSRSFADPIAAVRYLLGGEPA